MQFEALLPFDFPYTVEDLVKFMGCKLMETAADPSKELAAFVRKTTKLKRERKKISVQSSMLPRAKQVNTKL